MLTSHDAATYGAFMMEGLRDLDYDAVLEKWGQGCLEMVMEMTGHVPYLMSLVEDAMQHGCEFPGVLDYEVCAPFGKWFGECVLADAEGMAPNSEDCKRALRDLVYRFFNQGRT